MLKSVNLYWTRVGQQPGTGTLIGRAVRNPEGWTFQPTIAGHRGSRRYYPTWEQSLPRWTGGLDATTSTAVYDEA